MTNLILSRRDAIPLAHALAARLADRAGIRALSIKGPVADYYGLRAPRLSADADVLVEPDRFDEYCRLLEERGWHQRVGRDTPSVLPPHSRTYIHDSWPCDLDIHWMFPGFFAQPVDVFEVLWSEREELQTGHVEMSAPSRPASAVIGLLHAIRNEQVPRHVAERSALVALVIENFSVKEREAFYSIAKAGGALWVLRDIIDATGVGPVVVDATPDDRRRWLLYSDSVELRAAAGWWEILRATPWWGRAGLVYRAIWVPRADIPRNDRDSPLGILEVVRYQIERMGRGVRGTLRYVVRLGRR